jgi:hypothetical protein
MDLYSLCTTRIITEWRYLYLCTIKHSIYLNIRSASSSFILGQIVRYQIPELLESLKIEIDKKPVVPITNKKEKEKEKEKDNERQRRDSLKQAKKEQKALEKEEKKKEKEKEKEKKK